MWVFTQHGFVSIVSSREDPKVVMVRARDRKSLEQFIEALEGEDPFTDEALEILETKYTDYPYRVVCSRTAAAQFLADEALAIDYSNFKSRVTKTRGHSWHDVLLSIWGKALGLSDRPKPSYFRATSWTCEGITKKGKKCTHDARIAYQTCWQHADQEADILHQGSLTHGSRTGIL